MRTFWIYGIFSLSFVSFAHAQEVSVEEQCRSLGYNTNVSDCAEGAATLMCPFGSGSTGLAVCIIDACRGYPLFKENNKFYYLDTQDNKMEAFPLAGSIEDYVDGEWETCTAGYGDGARTYYRTPKCKGKALYNDYFCDIGCDIEKKYPYAYHPGNIAGTVRKCVSAEQTYYGYSSCNKGWLGGWNSDSGIGRCALGDCDMVEYPYPVEPNTEYYRESRGNTETCKIGGATYYKYTECSNSKDYMLQGSVCARKCEITECENQPFEHTYPNGNTATINDWYCKLSNSRCQVGDIITMNGKEIGFLASISDNELLLYPVNYKVNKYTWSIDRLKETPVPQLKASDQLLWGKIATKGMLMFAEQNGCSAPEQGKEYCLPAAEQCVSYQPENCKSAVCSVGEWYYSNLYEIETLLENKYIIANGLGDHEFPNRVFCASVVNSESNIPDIRIATGIKFGAGKMANNSVVPMLSIKRK